MDTVLELQDIENAIARHFGVRENIIVPHVSWGYFRTHEADMVVISKSGYLTEIEIKRSWSDFLQDFKKTTNHYENKVDRLYYCVPDSLYERVLDYLLKDVDWSKYNFDYVPSASAPSYLPRIPCGVMTYTEQGSLQVRQSAPVIQTFFHKDHKDYRLFIEEQLAIARLGTLRYWSSKVKPRL